jgi:hypothetical protein
MRADYIPAPYSTAGDNEFRCLSFTGPTTHATNIMPVAWHGKYISIFPIGTDGDQLHYAFAKNDSDAEVDSGVTATAAGASAKVGGIAPMNQKTMVRVPNINPDDAVYFVRESDGTAADAVIVALEE